jgi:hypothetical protein
MRGEHREKARGVPTSVCREVIYPSGVRGRWVALLAAVAAAVLVAVVLTSRGGSTPKPSHVSPAHQVGEDADLMRRLERHKLVKGSK